jgi:nicotinamide phosphoribosyltransferase
MACLGLCQKNNASADDEEVIGANGAILCGGKVTQALDQEMNILMLTDSYKVSHHKQYPKGTSVVYSYFESRGCEKALGWSECVFFGLQYFIKQYLVGEVVTKAKLDEAEEYFKIHFSNPAFPDLPNPFYREGWEHILNKHGGRLPIVIKAVPEGTVVPLRNVLLTIENTDPACFWLPNYLETLLVQVWYPMTVATQSREQKKIIHKWLVKTASDGEDVDPTPIGFRLHDFGFRGVSSTESAALGGCAHLVSFMGTDTMAALICAKKHYHEQFAGFSVPASEHSTMTSWGREGECDAMKNMLTKYPKGIVACVSDSYDVFNACKNYWGGELKDLILQREGKLVVRPDSGELPGIVTDVLEALATKFETKTTQTGHKYLPPQIGVIQGDGINIGSLEEILAHMDSKGWAASAMAFGSGGALLQKLHRDTLKCAFKASHCVIEGKDVNVFKDPITDPGKKSKMGRLTLEKAGDSFTTVTEGKGDPAKDCLVEVFRDGVLLVDQTLAEIRARAEIDGLKK